MDAERYCITNQRAQPLELHLPGRVLIVGPHAQAELSAAELAEPQLQHLRRRRLLHVSPLAPPVAPPPVAPPSGGETEPAEPPETPPAEPAAGEPEPSAKPKRSRTPARPKK